MYIYEAQPHTDTYLRRDTMQRHNTCICTRVYMHTNVYAYICIYIYVYIYIYEYVHEYIPILICISLYECFKTKQTSIQIHICIRMYMNKYI